MNRWLKYSLLILAGILVFLFVFGLYQFRDRHKGYDLNLSLQNEGTAGLSAGFAIADISPVGYDTWQDVNGDAEYNEEEGDYYNDLNQNGKFDPIWLAGFQQNRPASGINDPLWARAMVLDNGQIKFALCVIDMIGFGNDEVVSLRKKSLNKQI